MADLFASRAPVRLNDGTADANNAVIANGTPGGSDYALVVRNIPSGTQAVSGTISVSGAVDTELPAAEALTDNFANPTAPAVGAFTMLWDGATWDRAPGTTADGVLVNLGSNNDVTVTSGSIAVTDVVPGTTATKLGKAVDSVAGATDTGVATLVVRDDALGGLSEAEGDYVPLRVDANGSLYVTGGGGGTEYTVNAVAPADPIGKAIVVERDDALSALSEVEGDWTNLRGNANGALWVIHDGTMVVSGSVTADTELPAAASLTDNFANPTAPGVGAFGMVWDGATWDRSPGTGADGTLVNLGSNNDVTVTSGSITADTELPAAAVLADATANPTVPGVGGFMLGYNGTTWDRVRTANTGRLQVDVVTGGGTAAPSELPSGYNMIDVYGATSGTAAGGTATVATNTPANTKNVYVRQVMVSASGAVKYQLKFDTTVLATGFTSPETLTSEVRFDPPIPLTGDGASALKIDVTNRELSAMDLYARLNAIVQA